MKHEMICKHVEERIKANLRLAEVSANAQRFANDEGDKDAAHWAFSEMLQYQQTAIELTKLLAWVDEDESMRFVREFIAEERSRR